MGSSLNRAAMKKMKKKSGAHLSGRVSHLSDGVRKYREFPKKGFSLPERRVEMKKMV